MARQLGWLFGVLLLGCGAASTPSARFDAQRPASAPASQGERIRALDEFARRVFQLLQQRSRSELVFGDATLERLLDPAAALRATARRDAEIGSSGPAPGLAVLRGSTYVGACIQGLRDEPPGSVIGLRQPGWLFERMLLVAQEPTGRIAFWVEGEFLWTDLGFGAISIQPPETPRRNHSDLELAVCDVDLGLQHPQSVVSGVPFNH